MKGCCVEAYDMKTYAAKLITAIIGIMACTLPVSGETIAATTLTITLYVPSEPDPAPNRYENCIVERNGSTITIEAR